MYWSPKYGIAPPPMVIYWPTKCETLPKSPPLQIVKWHFPMLPKNCDSSVISRLRLSVLHKTSPFWRLGGNENHLFYANLIKSIGNTRDPIGIPWLVLRTRTHVFFFFSLLILATLPPSRFTVEIYKKIFFCYSQYHDVLSVSHGPLRPTIRLTLCTPN